ncbi:hypothetical protein PUN28_009398 [Cardiocondyla obscurior]|uniref:Uncharacterized protein n=1 Tax=Cardiocondyla obscurior TaxID=286306 RepID=A0AAW2FTJ8_9HYME
MSNKTRRRRAREWKFRRGRGWAARSVGGGGDPAREPRDFRQSDFLRAIGTARRRRIRDLARPSARGTRRAGVNAALGVSRPLSRSPRGPLAASSAPPLLPLVPDIRAGYRFATLALCRIAPATRREKSRDDDDDDDDDRVRVCVNAPSSSYNTRTPSIDFPLSVVVALLPIAPISLLHPGPPFRPPTPPAVAGASSRLSRRGIGARARTRFVNRRSKPRRAALRRADGWRAPYPRNHIFVAAALLATP